MIDTSTAKLAECEAAIRDRLGRSKRAWMAGVQPHHRILMSACVVDHLAYYARRGIVDRRALREKVKAAFVNDFGPEFGSIWVSIIFAIVWAIIQKKFF